jgi:hypothetical protein
MLIGSPHIVHSTSPRILLVLLSALATLAHPRLVEAALKALNAFVNSMTADCIDIEDFSTPPLPIELFSVS